MNENKPHKFGNSGKGSKSSHSGSGRPSGNHNSDFRKPKSGGRSGSFGKKSSSAGKSSGTAGKPFYQTKLKGNKHGAQQGDYVMISDGKKKITTRINLPNHPFAKKEVGEMVVIKGVEWYLIRIFQQGTAAYNKIYDADTQREHFGY